MKVVIYARYSSHNQTEQSIEGQLQVCYEYAKQNGMNVIGEYIDRAKTGTNANREEFQRMITDSARHTFEAVLVYQLDRFARSREDSAINKARLKKNGVRVISAKEQIGTDPSGILIESVLEGMAEYYSAELSQKIRRGMDINAEKHLSTGSNPGLGYKVDKATREFYVDPQEAIIVREIFERYASGETVADIIRDLNTRQIKTSLGRDFNKNSLARMLRNRRYIGVYIYRGQETPGAMPRIIEDELFDRVQRILDRNKEAPARSRGKEEYILTTKLFCGHCKEKMVGFSGKGRSGRKYCYYACKNAKKHQCTKKSVDKEMIEDKVVLACQELLTDESIQEIAKMLVAACEESRDYDFVGKIKNTIRETEQAIEALWVALEKGQAAELITGRIEKRQQEKEKLEAQLALELAKETTYSEQDVKGFLLALKRDSCRNEDSRRILVNIFVKAVFLYDEHLTIIFNGTKREVTLEHIPLDKIESVFGDKGGEDLDGSPLGVFAPPKRLETAVFGRFSFCVWACSMLVLQIWFAYGLDIFSFFSGSKRALLFP